MHKHTSRFLILMIVLILNLSSCLPNQARPLTTINTTSDQGIVYYDINFEINPSQKIFRSQQRVTITGNLAKKRILSIFIRDDLVIDRLALQNEAGDDIAIAKWRKVDSYPIDYFWGQVVIAEIEIQTEKEIRTDGRLIVNLDYHLPEEKMHQGLATNLYELFYSPEGSQTGGPESGAFVMVSGKLEAPFTMTIKHPGAFQCVMPGEQIDLEEAEGFVSVSYRADHPYDPSFSCAPYKILSEKIKGLQIDIFFPPEIDLSPKMLDMAAQILSLYQEKFGQAPAQSFRIVFPNLDNDEGGGESNGNLVILGNVQPYINYDEDEEAQDTFAILVGHEGYHLWNAWGLSWEGTLAEWWVEGGATFMATWEKEILFGAESGANDRLRYIQSFDEQEAYLYKKSLANLDDDWFEDWALVYEYGALVWEQLRLQVGSEALTSGLRDFYETHGNQTTNYTDFIACLQKHTPVDVAGFLDQWTQHNARIDLMINDVVIQLADGHYDIQVDLEVDADRDYEFFTTLGYKTSLDGDWQLIDLHLIKSGQHQVKFESEQKPLEIQIDPEYRVPQINPENNTWSEDNNF